MQHHKRRCAAEQADDLAGLESTLAADVKSTGAKAQSAYQELMPGISELVRPPVHADTDELLLRRLEMQAAVERIRPMLSESAADAWELLEVAQRLAREAVQSKDAVLAAGLMKELHKGYHLPQWDTPEDRAARREIPDQVEATLSAFLSPAAQEARSERGELQKLWSTVEYSIESAKEHIASTLDDPEALFLHDTSGEQLAVELPKPVLPGRTSNSVPALRG